VFEDSNILKFANLGMPLEYFECNAETISLTQIGAISSICIPTMKPSTEKRDSMSPQTPKPSPLRKPVDKRKLMQNLLLHNATVDAKTLTDLGIRLMNTRELALSNIIQSSRSAKLGLMFTSISPLFTNLRKLELSSIDGFSDKDLALAVKNCPQIQWCELAFSFTFVKTLASLSLCRKLLYVKLHRYSTPTSSRVVPNGKGRYLASSRECKSVIAFAKNSPSTLRMMDFGGEWGITDYTLSQTAKHSSSALHSIFLDGLNVGENENLTTSGIVKFAEGI
jgi:hypothetical protein